MSGFTNRISELARENTAWDEFEERQRTQPTPPASVPVFGPVTLEPDPPVGEEWFDDITEREFASWPAPVADAGAAERAVHARLQRSADRRAA